MQRENKDTEDKTVKVVHEYKEKVLNVHYRNPEEKETKKDTLNENDKSLIEEIRDFKFTIKSPRVCVDNSATDRNIAQLSSHTTGAKGDEKENEKSRRDSNAQVSSKRANKGIFDALKKKSGSGKISKIDTSRERPWKTSNKKYSPSDSSFKETITTDYRVDPFLNHDVRKKGTKKRLSKDYLKADKTVEFKLNSKSETENTKKMNLQREAHINKIVNNFLDDVRVFSLKGKQQHNKNQSAPGLQNKYPSRNTDISSNMQQKSTFSASWHKNRTYQKRPLKFPCQRCYDAKLVMSPVLTLKPGVIQFYFRYYKMIFYFSEYIIVTVRDGLALEKHLYRNYNHILRFKRSIIC